jgi:hypothetical protein
MIDVSYTITGAAEVQRDLQKIALDTLRSDIAAILSDMGDDAATYPPELPNQRYRRTNALHDEWISADPVMDLQGEALTATLTNATPHGPWVQGEDQAAVHAGRWRTTEQIMAAWEDRVAARVEDTVGRLIGT